MEGAERGVPCASCGRSAGRTREGLCVACMLSLALQEPDELAVESLQLSESPSELPELPPDYQPLERLGAGGMGTVWKALQKSTQRVVALKLLHGSQRLDSSGRRRLLEEARAAARLRHPHIVTVYELREHRGEPLLAMEYIAGGSLAERMRRQPFAPNEAARIVLAVADALAYAHARNVIHLDLKPQNILLDEQGLPYVSDFGLARRLDVESSETFGGETRGTPSYMAPEQTCEPRSRLTPQCDVYGLAATLYACLTGRPPFAADTLLETLRRVREEEPTAPRKLVPTIPRALEAICLRGLHKEPTRRYPNAQALADDVRRFLAGDRVHALAGSRVWHGLRRHRLRSLWVALGVVSLCTVALLATLARDERLDSALQSARLAASALRAGELRELGDMVESEARAPELALAIARDDTRAELALLSAAYHKARSRRGALLSFRNWHLLDVRGHTLSDFPARENRGTDRSFRDYYRGPLRRAAAFERDRAHFSRVYRSLDDGLYKFAISHPVRDRAGALVGFLAAMIGTRDLAGAGFSSRERTAVLIARTDRAPPGSSKNERWPSFVVMLHPSYRQYQPAVASEHGALPTLLQDTHDAASMAARDAHYRDPVAARDPRYLGRWLAGFARVEGTPFVVVFQVRDYVSSALYAAGLLVVLGSSAALLRVYRRRRR